MWGQHCHSMIVEWCFLGSFSTFLILERIFNAIGLLFIRLVYGKTGSTLKGYAALQVFGSGIALLTRVSNAIATVFVNTVGLLFSYILWATIISAGFTMLYVVHEYYPEFLIEVVEFWNQFAGPAIHSILVVPLRVFDIVFSALVPAWDWLVWVLTKFFFNVFLTGAIRDIENYRVLGVAFAAFIKSSFASLSNFIQTASQSCPQPVTDECFDLGRRALDIITPMLDARDIAIAVSVIIDNMCRGLSGPVDIAAFPWLDPNLAKGLHNMVNSVLATFINIPIVTAERCKAYPDDILMCLPDFEPAFNLMTNGLRSIGRLVDNWIDVSSLIIQSSLTVKLPLEDWDVECERLSLALTPANASKEVFGTKPVAIVGLTPGLYAQTDGTNIQYWNHYDSTESVLVTGAWPIEIDPSFGVAAVTYFRGNTGDDRDGLGNPTTTALGCRCDDDDGKPPMRITCALALYEQASYGDAFSPQSDLTFNVKFQTRSTAQYMTCKESQISVKSVRWPSTRFTRGREGDLEDTCQSRGDCNTIDATIWVAPLCSSDAGRQQEVCSPLFKLAACYPYCMAARRSGSAADGLVLYSALDWKERVHIMNRDCGVKTHLDNPVDAVNAQQASYLPQGNNEQDRRNVVETVTLTDILQGSVRTVNWDPDLGCVEAPGTYSVMGNNVHEGYRGDTPQSNRFRSLLMPGQPFAFAGDTTLTAVKNHDGTWWVKMDRLYGNEVRHRLFQHISFTPRVGLNRPIH